MATQFVGAETTQRYDTAANWTLFNPVLRAGQLGIESDTAFTKVGDGVSAWAALNYQTSSDASTALTQANAAQASASSASASASLSSITSRAWSASTSGPNSAVAQAMRSMTNLPRAADPVMVDAYEPANVKYLNPSYSGTNSGTFAQPYSTWAQAKANWTPGTALLLAAGTTLQPGDYVLPTATGTSGSPIAFGVYDPGTGKRLRRRPGAATIDFQGSTANVIALANLSYISLDCLNIVNAANPGAGAVVFGGTGTNCRVLDCTFSGNSAYCDVQDSSTNTAASNVIQGNSFVSASQLGSIYRELNANDSTIAINFNRCTGSRGGITLNDPNGGATGRYVAGSMSCNVVEDSDIPGIRAVCAGVVSGQSLKMVRNTSRRNQNGIHLQGSLVVGGVVVAGDFTGALVEDCDLHNNEFGLYLQGTRGVLAQFFRACGNGSKTGATWVTSSKYGRNVEIVSIAPTAAPTRNVIRYAYLTGAYCWITSGGPAGTEGVGMGFDDNSRDNECYGCYIADNEGNGIQFNISFGNRAYGNTLVNNYRTTRTLDLSQASPNLTSEIFLISSPFCEVFNNTIHSPGGTYQRGGVAELEGGSCVGFRNYNNFVIGTKVFGSAKSTINTNTREDHTIYIGPGAIVVSSETQSPITAGSGSARGQASDFDATSPFYKATQGGACDGTGAVPATGSVSLTGVPLTSVTPIGALHARY